MELLSLEKRGFQGDLSLKGACRKEGDILLMKECSDRTRKNGFKMKDGRFVLIIRKKSFTVRMMRHWSRFPREAVDAPPLDGASSNLV